MNRAESGFSLLEILIAMAMTALLLPVAINQLKNGVNFSSQERDYIRALSLYHSLYERTGTEFILSPSHYQGEDGQYRWVVDIQPYSVTEADQPHQFHLHWIAIKLNWGNNGEKSIDRKLLKYF